MEGRQKQKAKGERWEAHQAGGDGAEKERMLDGGRGVGWPVPQWIRLDPSTLLGRIGPMSFGRLTPSSAFSTV